MTNKLGYTCGEVKAHLIASQIVHPTQEQTLQARIMYMNLHNARNDFLAQLREKGLEGSDYSDAVIAYDKNIQQQHFS